jgi:hypothetical protein
MCTLRTGASLLLCLALFSGINQPVQSEKILAVAFMSSKSHKIVYEPLLLELGKRGHQVTIVTPIPAKKESKNVKQILTFDYMEMFNDMPNMFEMKEKSSQLNPFMIVEMTRNVCSKTWDLPIIKELMKEEFDLVISQPLFNDCAMGFIHHFKAPLVLITPISTPPMFTWITGTPAPRSFNPHFFLTYTDKMTYSERMINFAAYLGMSIIDQFFIKPMVTKIYREKLGNPNIPTPDEVLSNASLILSNGHFSIGTPKAFLPDIVEVAGMHCRPAQPLPKDLEDFVNSSGDDGFIFFSMGSAIQAHTMPEKYRKIFINTFAKLKQKVLWKWETETMEDLPKNVKLGKWLPQQDVLGHPKIRMFLTHGGYGGTTEAVYHGCPLLGIPMMGDQMLNMQKSQAAGFAVTLEFTDLSEETLLNGINRLLNEPSFKERAKSLSNIFRDQPDKPLDRAVYWTEYVMRHKGAVHMRSAARELNFFQYHSLDVIGSYLAILFGILYIIYAIGRFFVRMLCGTGKPAKPNSGKKTN